MRAALCRPDSALDWMDGCSAPALAEQIEEQSLVTMLYPTIRGQAGEAWEALAARLKPVYDRELHRGLMQEYEIGALLDDLERDGIDCLPMKGWVMRQYYPDPLMRSMADFDVLLKAGGCRNGWRRADTRRTISSRACTTPTGSRLT